MAELAQDHVQLVLLDAVVRILVELFKGVTPPLLRRLVRETCVCVLGTMCVRVCEPVVFSNAAPHKPQHFSQPFRASPQVLLATHLFAERQGDCLRRRIRPTPRMRALDSLRRHRSRET